LQVPAAPVAWSRPWQAKPAEQVPVVPVPQQAWPEPPQLLHTLPVVESEQVRPVVHAGLLGQQAWPEPPHNPQIPPASAPRPRQPMPLWQLPPAQHAAPLAPQLWQVAGWPPPGALQPRPALQVWLAQQA
jgi:hypothetical protein